MIITLPALKTIDVKARGTWVFSERIYKVKVCYIRARFAVTSVDHMPLLFLGYELTNNTLTTIQVSDYFDCVTACLAEQRCCSVNFKPEGISICNLNKRCRRKRQEDGCLKRSDHAVYYELSNTRGWDVVSEVNDVFEF